MWQRRSHRLPDETLTVLYARPSVLVDRRPIAGEQGGNLPSIAKDATFLLDVIMTGAWPKDEVQASPATSSRYFDTTAHVWTNDSVRVAARNLYLTTLDIGAATISVEVTERRIP